MTYQAGEIPWWKMLKDTTWCRLEDTWVVTWLYPKYRHLVSLSQPPRRQIVSHLSPYRDQLRIALTFDVAWGNQQISQILEVLNHHHIRATFFISGIWAERYPEDCRKILIAGHEIGNHSHSHAHMTALPVDKALEDILTAQRLLREATGTRCRLFRFPFGEYDQRLVDIVYQNGFTPIGWSVATRDWEDIGSGEICTNILGHDLKSGDIILMHASGPHVVAALEQLLPVLRDRSFSVIPVSDGL